MATDKSSSRSGRQQCPTRGAELKPRALLHGDALECYELERAEYAFHWSLEQWQGCIAKHGCQGIFLGNQMVAVCVFSLVADEATLLNVVVANRHRRQGLAEQLILDGEHKVSEQGANCCFLEVRASNKAARNLYQKLDYLTISRRPGYYPTEGGKEDALIMKKLL